MMNLFFSLPRIMVGPVEVPAFCQNLEHYIWNLHICQTSPVIRLIQIWLSGYETLYMMLHVPKSCTLITLIQKRANGANNIPQWEP